MNFTSFAYEKFKLNAFSTFFFRAWRLSKTYMEFNIEIQFLRTFFLDNGYHDSIFYRQLKDFLNKRFDKKPTKLTVEKEIMYVKFPFSGDKICKEINGTLKRIISQHFPQMKMRTTFYNHFKIKSFFKHKDAASPLWCSDIVYKYNCAVCNNCYIGSTNRSLYTSV